MLNRKNIPGNCQIVPDTASAVPYWLSQAAQKYPDHWIVFIADSSEQVAYLKAATQCFLTPEIPVYAFPDWEILPYDHFSPHPDIVSERVELLYHLSTRPAGIFIAAANAFLHKMSPKQYLLGHAFFLQTESIVDLEQLKTNLLKMGYVVQSQVTQPGELAFRGSILDLFPMGSPEPYRVDFLDQTVDSIRVFDPDSQRSIRKETKICLLPAREFPMDKKAIDCFVQQWSIFFDGDPSLSPIYNEVRAGLGFPGIEYYWPLFFESGRGSSIFDYLPEKTVVFRTSGLEQAAQQNLKNIGMRFEQYRHDRQKPILPPDQLFLPIDQFFQGLKQYQQYVLEHVSAPAPFDWASVCNQIPHKRVVFTAESTGRREIVREHLSKQGLNPTFFESWSDVCRRKDRVCLFIAPLESLIETEDFIIVPEFILFGKKATQTSSKRSSVRAPDKEAEDFSLRYLAELSLNDPLVHLNHGIGRYQGLVNLSVEDQPGEFLCLSYAGGDKVYVPVSALHLISRYSGVDPDTVPLHKLGSAEWQGAKKKAAEQIRDVAGELLAMYAQRQAKSGEPIQFVESEYRLFEAQFPFEETLDQLAAIAAIKADLLSAQPMDRVICGDVGFGKTEVALRAAFMAVQSGWQVVFLVPTTLLAQQHYDNFVDRFAAFPVRIAQLSRFKNKRDQDSILEGLAAGQIDIIVGTHKLMQKQIQYKHLGLVIIDEEHRFGVRQKDQFKALRSNVHILTMTATPIPRTLNMALSGIRDLSIIATPPARRLSIKTFVENYSLALIQEAIERELYRGGQVYYLHNNVETIERRSKALQDLLPHAKIAVAHGQMHEKALERVMSDFYHKRFNVLICTSIIETGIDVPTANTILIERADKFGLAQLHQLRGRVGRSHHQAYAFCLLPPEGRSSITADAQKRLDALEQSEELGSGFNLATQDLEIRGAGALLGDEQSGRIQEIGYHLYMDLLERAVSVLKEDQHAETDCFMNAPKTIEIDLQLPAFIPDSYVPDVTTRLVLYKKIANLQTQEAVLDLQFEFEDRFGKYPAQTLYLFEMAQLRIVAQALRIVKIGGGQRFLRVEFDKNPNIDVQQLIQMIQQEPHSYRLDEQQRLQVSQETLAKDRIKALLDILLKLMPNPVQYVASQITTGLNFGQA